MDEVAAGGGEQGGILKYLLLHTVGSQKGAGEGSTENGSIA